MKRYGGLTEPPTWKHTENPRSCCHALISRLREDQLTAADIDKFSDNLRIVVKDATYGLSSLFTLFSVVSIFAVAWSTW